MIFKDNIHMVKKFSKQSHPKLFDTYWNSIHEIIKNSKAWTES